MQLKDLHRAITRLGLNPTDQEIVDISNYIAKFVQVIIGLNSNCPILCSEMD